MIVLEIHVEMANAWMGKLKKIDFQQNLRLSLFYQYFRINEYECICDPGWGGFSCDENMVWF